MFKTFKARPLNSRWTNRITIGKITASIILVLGLALIINLINPPQLADEQSIPNQPETSESEASADQSEDQDSTTTVETTDKYAAVNNYSGQTYAVTKVVDGDTIWINLNGTNTKIRFIGINTPESTTHIECYGNEASNYLKSLLTGQMVGIELDSSQGETDKYGRTLAYIYYNNENVNLKLLQEGYAYEYTYNTPYKYQTEFVDAEADAKNSQIGLWSPDTCNGQK